jgi:putrescine transport system permease protein
MTPAPRRRALVAVLPMLWLGAFFALPLGLIVKLAFSSAVTAQPPYLPTFDLGQGWARLIEDLSALSLDNFTTIFADGLYLAGLLSSLRLAAIATCVLLAIAYPLALAMARAPAGWKPLLVALVILPFWTSFLIRVYAWIGILRPEGYLDIVLQALGLSSGPLHLLNTDVAIVLGIVYAYLPFMVLPIHAAVEKLDPALGEAAQDLGAAPWRVFLLVTLPLTVPAAAAGALMVFIPAAGEVIIPDLLGGSDTLMIGRLLWAEFFSNRDWPLASALALLLLAALALPILLWRRLERRSWEGAR